MSLPVLITSLIGLLGAFALVPVLIHLINLMRHRRVQWAAMDFLLQSYKRHRNWIWLKQLLLLLMRITAMVLIALMLSTLAHFLMNSISSKIGVDDAAIGNLLGGRTTHHYVVVDDSYSMADRVADMTAFERARRTIQTIARRAGNYDHQRFTLLRYSRAAGGSSVKIEGQVAEMADLNAVDVDKDFSDLLEVHRNQVDVSELAVDAVAALNVTGQLLRQREDEKAVVYLVSDFRSKQWDNPAEIQKSLQRIKDAGAEIQLVNCVRTARPNLAITRLVPENETRAAGVPLFVSVTVRNFGVQPATKVQVKVRTLLFDPDEEIAGEPDQVTAEIQPLPTVYFEEIAAGQEATSRIQVFFSEPGKQVVEATLQEDALPTDNRRSCVVDVLDSVAVLIVDGSPRRINGYFLASVFAPGGKRTTGIRPDVQSLAYLRDARPEQLQQYQVIYLADVNVDQLGATSIAALEDFVRRGGGLGIFAGPRVDPQSYNERLYRDGQGVFPLPLGSVVQLDEQPDKQVPDIVATDHAIFNAVMSERNPLINMVLVSSYLKPPLKWSEQDDTNLRVIARLRNGDPLAVERQFGDGRVVALTTTLGPDWNNWKGNPTFVVTALKMQAFLANLGRGDLARVAGASIRVQLNADAYRDEVTFVLPGETAQQRTTIDRNASKDDGQTPQLTVALGGPNQLLASGETDRTGVYEAWAFANDGSTFVQRYAVNVDPMEGDLALADSKVLLAKLSALKPSYLHWDEMSDDPVGQAGFQWGRWVLLVLAVLLIAEQFVAYTASYHTASPGAVR